MSNDIRDRLAQNSRAFLERAAEELEQSPRHAVVDLATGIELLLKARLAHEHWSLVDEQPGNNSLRELQSGEETKKTVGLKKAIARIKRVVGPCLSNSDTELLEGIGTHRNKVVHFFHDKLDSKDLRLLTEVAAEQCKAWLLIERLITRDWKEPFEHQRAEWDQVRQGFKKNGVYLREKYFSLKPVLEGMRAKGERFEDCLGCTSPASKVTANEYLVFETKCLVCDASRTEVRVVCSVCDKPYVAEPEVDPYCYDCDRDLWQDMGLEAEPTGHCEGCYGWGPTTHAALNGNDHMCAMCVVHDAAVKCGRCGVAWIQAADKELIKYGCKECAEPY